MASGHVDNVCGASVYSSSRSDDFNPNFIPLHSKVSKKVWKQNKPDKKSISKRLGAKHKK